VSSNLLPTLKSGCAIIPRSNEPPKRYSVKRPGRESTERADPPLLITSGPWYLRKVVVEYVVKIAEDSTQAAPTAFALWEKDENELGDIAGANMSPVDGFIVVT
jgi:hypothetical protein